jgi:alkylhydroperoxidase family enzyme
LREVGLTDEEVWDVAETTPMYNFTNRMALALDRRWNEEYHRLDR